MHLDLVKLRSVNPQFMFTVEIKINGSMIGHIYGHNKADIANGVCRYEYEYYQPELRKMVCGEVTHARDDGIRELISMILNDVNKQEASERKKRLKAA